MSNKEKLSAVVAVSVVINGERHFIPPGDEVPEGLLSAHDRRELLASGSIKSSEAEAAAQKAEEKTAAEARAAFEAERDRIQAARESVAAVDTSAQGGAASAAKGGSKKS